MLWKIRVVTLQNIAKNSLLFKIKFLRVNWLSNHVTE